MYRWRARRASERQSGYMLLLLMLAVAMLAITLLGVATNYRQSIRRDREVEMIHRGVQYERAVRIYYRKNNSSYPPSIDRLLETNKVRYLRKAYKDPMTPDGTWKIAHLTDVNLPAANTGLGTTGTPATGTGSGGLGGTPTGTGAGLLGAATGATSGASTPDTTQTAGTGGADQSTATTNTTPANTSGGAGPVLGGGAMIGVVSKSKQEGVHSFNEKSQYNEWLFIYLPTQDTNQLGAIPNGPFNPKATTNTGLGGQTVSTTPTPGSTQGTTTGTTTPGTNPGTMPASAQ